MAKRFIKATGLDGDILYVSVDTISHFSPREDGGVNVYLKQDVDENETYTPWEFRESAEWFYNETID